MQAISTPPRASSTPATGPRIVTGSMPLRIGVLSSWNARCGIAEYTRSLVDALRRQDDVQVTVFGSRNYGERATKPFEEWAVPVFDVQVWHPESRFGLDVEAVLEHELDVLLIEFSTLFYDHGRLVELLRRFPGVRAVAYHDKEGLLAFPCELVDLIYTHRADVGGGSRRVMLHVGIDLRPPVVKTFGLGKSRLDVIGAICERNGWDFQHSFGSDRWLDSEELFAWLRDCDAIVLWYNDKLGSGGSAAAPFAIGTRRPVFVNDTNAFVELPERTANLRKLRTADELEAELRELFANDYAEERTWDGVATTLIADFREAVAFRQPRATPSHRGLRETAFVTLDHKPLRGIVRRLKARARNVRATRTRAAVRTAPQAGSGQSRTSAP
jgi:hypothetical protein